MVERFPLAEVDTDHPPGLAIQESRAVFLAREETPVHPVIAGDGRVEFPGRGGGNISTDPDGDDAGRDRRPGQGAEEQSQKPIHGSFPIMDEYPS